MKKPRKLSVRYLDPPATTQPKRPPHFTPEKWSATERLKRLRKLSPKKADAIEQLLLICLSEEWPTPASLRKEWRRAIRGGA